MKLFLIRHAETVDNVAGLYAGVRDSVLTNHGVDQANKLGEHLAKTGVRLTHIFASPLTRTSKTADAIRKAQTDAFTDASLAVPEIVKVAALIEQDFGYYEGKPFQARAADSKKTGRELHREKHKDDAGFVDVESKESMAKRADQFLEDHLLPLLTIDKPSAEGSVAVVSHGMLLSHLWRRLLLRLPRRSLTIAPEVTTARGDLVLEHLGGWSNTGYLQLLIRADVSASGPLTEPTPSEAGKSRSTSDTQTLETPIPPPMEPVAAAVEVGSKRLEINQGPIPSAADSKMLAGYSTVIKMVDSKQHLAGLKRQRGGIGRSAHDEKQKKLDGFFKKQRLN